MIHRRLHTLFEFGSELDVVQAISQATCGDSINCRDESGQTLLYKAAVQKKRLVLKALIEHPLIDVDMTKAIDCPLLMVIGRKDFESLCLMLQHSGFIAKDWYECISRAFALNDTRLLLKVVSHTGPNNTNRTTPAPSQFKPAPPPGPHPARPPQPPPPPAAPSPSANVGNTMPSAEFLPKKQPTPPQDKVPESSTAAPPSPHRKSSPVRTAQEWSWLAVRLHKAGFDYHLVRDCERKLVTQEGFVAAKLFAALPAAELTFAYLNKIGITAKGLQLELMHIHRALQPTTKTETTTEFGQAKCRRNDCALMREMVDRLATKNVKLQQALKVQQNAIDGLAAKLATL